MRKSNSSVILLGIVLALYSIFQDQSFAQVLVPADVLYHGSTNRNIKVFEPRADSVRDKNEGPVVFATPSLKLASCYLFKWDDSWVDQPTPMPDGDKTDYQVVMVISDKSRFKKEDKGGSIYILPAHGFKFDESKGLGIYEGINRAKVTPISQLNFSSGLEAMQQLGVQVHFVSREQFRHYLSLSSEEQKKFLLQLKETDKPT